jgi:acetyltransferase
MAEFAAVVSDSMQGKGLGTELVKRLIEIARAEKIARVRGDILAENTAMLNVCKKLGFRSKRSLTDPTVEVELALT